jgi:hypothetical protein
MSSSSNTYKLKLLTTFQHWLGTHYKNLPTDSGNMTERARHFLKENPDIFDLLSQECECKPEWMIHNRELNAFPYGNDIEFDKCKQCGKIHNTTVI